MTIIRMSTTILPLQRRPEALDLSSLRSLVGYRFIVLVGVIIMCP